MFLLVFRFTVPRAQNNVAWDIYYAYNMIIIQIIKFINTYFIKNLIFYSSFCAE